MSKNPRKFRQPVRLIVSIEAQTATRARLPVFRLVEFPV